MPGLEISFSAPSCTRMFSVPLVIELSLHQNRSSSKEQFFKNIWLNRKIAYVCVYWNWWPCISEKYDDDTLLIHKFLINMLMMLPSQTKMQIIFCRQWKMLKGFVLIVIFDPNCNRDKVFQVSTQKTLTAVHSVSLIKRCFLSDYYDLSCFNIYLNE